MTDSIALPIVVLETETGDLEVLHSVADAVLFAEEFLDILDDDFALWDARGRSLSVRRPASQRQALELAIGPDDHVRLRRAIDGYLEKTDRDESVARTLRERIPTGR